MIDIHSHILNNVDDGSDSLEDTLNILRKAEKAGFSDIILTPHYIENYYDNTKDFINKKINELKQSLYREEIIVNLHQGNEIMLTDNTPKLLQEWKIVSLANSRYVLFELPFSNRMLNFENIIFELKEIGAIPVLAHPERYLYIQENPNELLEMLNLGILLQSNYGSFMGLYGKKAKTTAELLLKNKLIHFLGSDTHKQGTIYENIDKIIKELVHISGNSKYIRKITTINPQNILNDFEIAYYNKKT